MKAAAIQMTSTRDVRANLVEAGRLVGAAVEEGAELVVLPENFSFLGATDAERIAAAEPFGRGPAQDFLAEQAVKSGIWLVGGTIPMDRDEHGERASSRSLLFDPEADALRITTRFTCSTSTYPVVARSATAKARRRHPARAWSRRARRSGASA